MTIQGEAGQSSDSSELFRKVRSTVLLALALFSITLSVYMQAGNHEFLNFDDNDYVTANPHVTSGITGANVAWAFTSVRSSNWHPVTWLSHMADAQLYGMNPRGHHLTNVFLHAFSAVLLFLLFVRLTGARWQSLFVAALFALHPLHVESVAWVAERKDVLSAFFWFLTLLFYAEYVTRPKPALYLLALFSFLLGLMSKPMLVTLPVVMLLMDFWPLCRDSCKGQAPGRRGFPGLVSAMRPHVREKIPFFACALLSGAVTIYAQHTGGAMSTFDEIPMGLRIENAVVAYAKYLVKTLWPHDLAFMYPMPPSFPLWQVICSLLVVLLVSAATIRAGRRYPYLAFGWFWFLVTLVPVIGLVQVGVQSMADRYTYIPLTGLFVMAAWGVPDLAANLRYRQGVLASLAGAVILAAAAATWHQLGYWQDNVSLFRHALHVTSGNYIAHNNLGVALYNKGELDAAIREYEAALAVRPADSEVHNNLGNALAGKGDLDAAIREYQEAIRIHPTKSETHNNLGNALLSKGNPDAANKEFQRASAINPTNSEAHYNLGISLFNRGDLDEAIREYQEALAINPTNSAAHNNLGKTLAKKGDLDTAIKEYREAITTNPGNSEAHYNLGNALFNRRDLDGAIREYGEALAINPKNSEMHNNLGAALINKGDLDGAVREYGEALAINPNNSAARNNLGIALAQKRKRR